jgi:hypothetical protein
VEELERIYELYLEYQHQVEDLEAGGHDGTPLFADYVAERDRAWEAYVAQGGHEPPLHSASGGASTPTSSAGPTSSGGELGGPRDRPVIRHGSRGAAVADAQRRLGISDDGVFGDETRRHTRQFQRTVGLDDDGVIGQLTWTALLEPFSVDPRRPTTPTSPPPAEHDVTAEEDNTVTLTHGVLAFTAASAWCSDTVQIVGFADTGLTTTPIEVEVRSEDPAKSYAKIATAATAGVFTCSWRVLEVLPAKSGATVRATLDVHAKTPDFGTATPLRINFAPTLTKTHYSVGRAHFDVSAKDLAVLIESDIKYVKGWGASVVKLGASAPAGTGGLLDGQLTWNGYRWMKRVGVTPQYWNGSAWVNLPAGFVLADSNNFCVGFYETVGVVGSVIALFGGDGRTFTCQYGGTWPESFADWNIDAPTKQAKITQWTDNIRTTWTGKFDIKRKHCASTDAKCCRYSTKAAVRFLKQANFAAGLLIIADGNIRSNDSLFFLGEPRLDMAAHEFGHHMGNPDEYAGAVLDTSLNTDGATAGIDPNSIMGQNMTTVKKRHYVKVCTHLAAMVKTQLGKTFEYEAVPP